LSKGVFLLVFAVFRDAPRRMGHRAKLEAQEDIALAIKSTAAVD
jgi:hypothetical protein